MNSDGTYFSNALHPLLKNGGKGGFSAYMKICLDGMAQKSLLSSIGSF